MDKLSLFYSMLSDDEREKSHSFYKSDDRNKYIICRGILRVILSGYLKIPPQSLEFLYGPWGKPCLMDNHMPRFNLSHSGNYVMYAFTLCHEVGIDVEYVDKKMDIRDIGDFLFSSAHETGHNKKERTYCIFDAWVCFEAYLKASGKGWSGDEPLWKKSDISALLKYRPIRGSKMTFPYCFRRIKGYASALFIEGPFLRIKHYTGSNSY